jgi:glycosyltransferase involved in cell wall biosynthesis
MTPQALLVGLHLRWDGVRQRPQHLLSRFAAHVPVIVIEEPFPSERDDDELRYEGDVTIVRPLRTRIAGAPFVDERALATARALLGEHVPTVMLYTPMMNELADATFAGGARANGLVYDCMDDLASFMNPPPGMVAREHALLERADVVFTGGRSLYDARKALGPKVHCYPSAVEFERFYASRTTAPHPICAELSGPVFGYTGVIDERIDVDLITALADAPDAPHVMMVGPFAKVDPAIFPRRSNVHFTGKVAYESLPSFLAGFDVALMPFARNASTAYISPTKTLEYFAAGVPVASTSIADVVADYADVVSIGDEPRAFVDACARARTLDPAQREKATGYARGRTWDATAEAMWRDISAAT